MPRARSLASMLPSVILDAYHGLLATQDKPLWQRVLLTAIHGGIALVRASRHDLLFVRAATLSYWTLVAIVPVLALAFALMGPLGLIDTTAAKLKEGLYSTVLAGSVADVGPWLDTIVGGIKLEALGVIGFLGVLIAGSKMYMSVEQAFNDIFRVRQRRRWLVRITLFYAVVTLGPLLLSAGFAATANLGETLPSGLLGRIVPISLTTAALVLAIKLLPHTEVRWKAALAGGLLTAVLFESLKIGFEAYTTLLGASNTMVRLYGGLALFPVFLLYVYLLWLVVLMGVEVAYVVHHARPLLAEERDRLRMGDIWRRRPDACFGLQVMIALSEHFHAGGGSINGERISDLLGTPSRAVQEALEMLVTASLLTPAEGGGYVPAQPLESLTAARVVRACRAVSVPSCTDDAPGNEAVNAALEAISRDLDISLSALIHTPRSEPTEAIELPKSAGG